MVLFFQAVYGRLFFAEFVNECFFLLDNKADGAIIQIEFRHQFLYSAGNGFVADGVVEVIAGDYLFVPAI